MNKQHSIFVIHANTKISMIMPIIHPPRPEWTSKEEVQSAAVESLQKYAPTMALQFAQHVKDGNVKIVRAAGSLITADGQGFRYNLAEILSQTYGRRKYSSAAVFGKEEHFNTVGIDAIVQNYFDLAARLVESMKGVLLFLTAA